MRTKQRMMKMKLLPLLSILALVLLLVGCTAEKAAPEQQTEGGEAASEPTAEQIQSELDTAPLDSIESDLDSLVLE